MAVVRCPNKDCGALLRIKEEARGKRGRCPKCGKAFQVPQIPETTQATRPTEAKPAGPTLEELIRKLPRDTGPAPTEAFLTLDQDDLVARLAAQGPDAVPVLVKNLRVSTGVAMALGMIGDRRAVTPLLLELGCNDWRRMAAAARALGQMKAVEAVPVLQRLRDSHPWAEVAQAAGWALGQFPVAPAAAAPAARSLSGQAAADWLLGKGSGRGRPCAVCGKPVPDLCGLLVRKDGAQWWLCPGQCVQRKVQELQASGGCTWCANPIPAEAKLAGGLSEPYCSRACYNEAGQRISALRG